MGIDDSLPRVTNKEKEAILRGISDRIFFYSDLIVVMEFDEFIETCAMFRKSTASDRMN
jgi:hypothetical protein